MHAFVAFVADTKCHTIGDGVTNQRHISYWSKPNDYNPVMPQSYCQVLVASFSYVAKRGRTWQTRNNVAKRD